jgi:uncharacterized membrane protein YbhN (UPF0104 family)
MRVARVIGAAILLAALVFLGLEVSAQWSDLRSWRPERGEVAVLLGLAGAHAAALFLLAEGWHRIVGLWGCEPRHRTYFAFTVSQVGRYLPGNVAHLLGRALFLRGGQLSDRDLARATFTEISTTPAGALLVLAAIAPAVPRDVLGPWPEAVRLALLAGPIMALAGWWLLRRGLGGLPPVSDLLGPILLAAASMAVLGGMFAAVMALVAPVPPLTVMAAALVAWLAGYATPGAPGGLGTREAVLLLTLGPVSDAASLLLATVLFRLTTTAGELACFAAGWPVRRVLRRVGGGTG